MRGCEDLEEEIGGYEKHERRNGFRILMCLFWMEPFRRHAIGKRFRVWVLMEFDGYGPDLK